MRFLRAFLLGASLLSAACSKPEGAAPPAPAAPQAVDVGVVRQSVTAGPSDVSDDIQNNSQRWGGAASIVYVGVAGGCNNQTGDRSRYFNLRFDLAGVNVPACATITDATLTLTQTGCATCGASSNLSLNRITTNPNWLESSASGSPSQCAGIASGGDSVFGVSGGTSVLVGGITSGTSPITFNNSNTGGQIVSDVQAFLAGSAFGWQIRSDAAGSTPDCSTCGGAGCGGNKKNIYAKEGTNPPTLSITYVLDNSRCNDGNACTNDVCTAGGCSNPAATGAACNDGVYCNGTDSCSNVGQCTVHAGDPCAANVGNNNADCSESCDEADDSCDANDPNGSTCNDGVACTTGDHCTSGTCGGTLNDSACDDGNTCTQDKCTAGGCSHPALTGNPCDDGTFCNGTDTCSSAGQCTVHGGDPCAGNVGDSNCSDSCNEGAKNCTAQDPNGSGCTDNIACTTGDACSGGACVGTPNNSLCNDGESCTTDTCSATTGCHNAALGDGASCAWDSNVCHKSTCSGGKCNQANTGAPCRAGSCSQPGSGDAIAVNPATCAATGGGTCPTQTTTDCGTQPCNLSNTACQGSCGVDTDCQTGFFCNSAGTCQTKLGPGSGCTRAGMCGTNFCTDGVCCNVACGNSNTNDCQACNTAASPGTCTNLSGTTCSDNNACTTKDTCNAGTCVGGAAPNCNDSNPCTVDSCDTSTGCVNTAGNANTPCRNSAGVCDLAEVCDGTHTACPADARRPSSFQCQAPSCTNGQATPAANCAGGTACPAPAPQPCSPYICGATACLTTCGSDNDCVAADYCKAGLCVTKNPPGVACTATNQCASGNCVDGVCCDKACNGQCQACNAAGSPGTCKTITGPPVSPRAPCAGDGSVCNGSCSTANATACTYPSGTTTCRPASCTNNVETLQAVCSGTGTCPALATKDCAPYVCGPTACEGSCSTDKQCQKGLFCSAGSCVPLLDSGGKCDRDTECKSAICADHMCCNARCTGQCEACDLPDTPGTCSVVKNDAPRNGRPACVTDKSVCAGTCDGSSRDACAYPGLGIQCRAPSCQNGKAVVAAYCQGIGACPNELDVDCGGACVGDLCGNECTTTCSLGQFCLAGLCHDQRDNGEQCNSAAECASSFCVDGVCCDGACNDQCQACDVAASPGTCTPVTGPPHGVRAPCNGQDPQCVGACDGNTTTGCTYPGATTVCSAGTCNGDFAVLPRTCLGDGSCAPVEDQLCAPFTCGTTKCAGDCTTDASCGTGKYCSAGICTAKLGDGAPCGGKDQCVSGNCVDGVCCDQPCDKRCEACDDPSSIGSCFPIVGRPHGGRPTCGGTAACEGRCDGKSLDTCHFPDQTVSCGAPVCTDGTARPGSVCNGVGSCLSSSDSTDCYPFACSQDGQTCATVCVTDDDCATGLTCQSGTCETPTATSPESGTTKDATAPDAASPKSDSGTRDGGTGGSPSRDAGTKPPPHGPDASTGHDGGAGKTPPKHSSDSGACGCRIEGAEERHGAWLGIVALGFLVARRRSRRTAADRR